MYNYSVIVLFKLTGGTGTIGDGGCTFYQFLVTLVVNGPGDPQNVDHRASNEQLMTV